MFTGNRLVCINAFPAYSSKCDKMAAGVTAYDVIVVGAGISGMHHSFYSLMAFKMATCLK